MFVLMAHWAQYNTCMKRITLLTATSFLLALLVSMALLSGCSDKITTPPEQTVSSNDVVYSCPISSFPRIVEVKRVDTAGSHTTTVLPGFLAATAHDKLLIIQGAINSGINELVVSNNQGSDRKTIYQSDSAHTYEGIASFSANGTRIVFLTRDSGANSKYHVHVIGSDGTGLRTISDRARYETKPALSADGAYVAYYEDWNGSTSLVVARTDGSSANKIATVSDPMVDLAGEVNWHPDGSRLAYTDNDHVYVINRDGSNRIEVGEGLNPRWSPDGTKLAFVRNVADYMWDIMITSDLGATLTNVTNTTAQWEFYLQWSPNSRYIVCQSGTGDPEHDPSSIKLIDITTGLAKVLATPGLMPYFMR